MRIALITVAILVGMCDLSAEREVFFNNFSPSVNLRECVRVYDVGNNVIRLNWSNVKDMASSGGISQQQYADGFKAVVFDLKVIKADNVTLSLTYGSPFASYRAAVTLPKPSSGWSRISFIPADFRILDNTPGSVSIAPGREMLWLGMECQGPSKASIELQFRNFAVETVSGKNITLFNPYALRDVYGSLDLYPSMPLKFQDDRKPRVIVAGIPILSPEWQWGLAQLQKKFGDALAVHISYPIFPRQAKAVEYFNSLGIKTTMESHQTVGYVDYLTNNRLFLTRDNGFTMNEPAQWGVTDERFPWYHHGLDFSTGDAVMPAVKQTVSRAARLGVSEYLDVDFIWPWNGRWGYGKTTVANFRKDLFGQDEGLEMEIEPGKYHKLDFWGYVKLFTDIKFTPAMVGCKSGFWSDYVPVTEAVAANGGATEKCNLFIFLALYHYECLKFIQREGLYCQSQGVKFIAGSNPEDIFNANDVYFTGRLRGVAKYGYEFFGSPFGTYVWYHNMQFYAGNLKKFGRDIYIIGEIFPGGHGVTLYDHEAAYAFYYDITAAAKPSDYNNQYVENHVWDGTPTADAYSQGRYGHWAAGAFAFLQSHAERPTMPSPKSTVVIGSRNVLEYQDGFSCGMGQTNNLAHFIDQLHYPFDSAGKEAMTGGFIDGAKILVYTPSQSSPMHLDSAKKWLNSKPGRVLITHSAVPFMIFNGQIQLARGILGVIWEYGKSYSRFVTSKIQKSANTLLRLESVKSKQKLELMVDGKLLTVFRDLYLVANSKTIFADANGQPLVSEIPYGSGKIIYINCTMPFGENEPFSRAVTGAALTAAGTQPEAIANAGTAVHLYEVTGGHSVVIWNSSQAAAQNSTSPRLFKRAPLVATSIAIPVEPGTYTVYDFYGDKETTQNVDAGKRLQLIQTGTCEVFYFGKTDNQDFRKTLASVQKTRHNVKDLDYQAWLKNKLEKAKVVYSTGFESGDVMPKDWNTWFPHRYIKDGAAGDTVHGGTRSIAIESPDVPDCRWVIGAKVDLHKKYMLTAWVKTVNCNKDQFVQLRLEQIKDGKFVSAIYGDSISGNTNGWQQLKLLFQPGTSQLNLLLVFGSNNGKADVAATAYFDDVELLELPE